MMIETAVIPAAGYGSRMKPITMVVPKEMLPLGHLPMLEHTVIELVSSGIKRIGIVIREGKEVIKEYFTMRKKYYPKVDIYFVYQKVPVGLGDALRSAKGFIGEDPFVMALPDQILLSEVTATKQLLDAYKRNEGIWNSMVRIPKKEIVFFQGARPFKYKRHRGDFCFIEGISAEETLLVRGFGRTVFLPESLEYMTKKFINEETGEVDLSKTFKALGDKFPLYGVILKGRPCDIGSWEGYYFYQPHILKYLNSNPSTFPSPSWRRGRG